MQNQSPLTYNQKLAIQRLASNSYSFAIPTITLNSLARRGLIEQVGDFYYYLTDKGILEYSEIKNTN